MIACLYALPRTEPLTPPSQAHGGTKWFGKPSPDRSSVAGFFILVCAAFEAMMFEDGNLPPRPAF